MDRALQTGGLGDLKERAWLSAAPTPNGCGDDENVLALRKEHSECGLKKLQMRLSARRYELTADSSMGEPRTQNGSQSLAEHCAG